MLLSSKPFLHEINHNVQHAQLFIHLVVAIGSTQMKWSVAVVIWSIHVSFVMHQDQLKRQKVTEKPTYLCSIQTGRSVQRKTLSKVLNVRIEAADHASKTEGKVSWAKGKAFYFNFLSIRANQGR